LLQIAAEIIAALIPISLVGYAAYLVLRALTGKKLLASRTSRAFIFAPILPAFCVALAVQNVMWFFASLWFSYLAIFLLALPAYLYISKRYAVNIWHCLVTGLLAGALPGFLTGLSIGLLLSVGFGITSALVFWLIGVKDWKKPTKN